MFDKPFKSLCGAISSWPYHHLNSRSLSLPPSLSSAFSTLAWAQLNFRNSISIVDIDVYVFTNASCIRSRQVSFVTVFFFFFRFSCGISYQSIIDSQMRMMWHAEWVPVSKLMPFIVIEKERETQMTNRTTTTTTPIEVRRNEAPEARRKNRASKSSL